MDYSLVGASFVLLLATELGDKTQLVIFALSARTRQTVAVFLGATLAFVILTALASGFGGLISGVVPENWLNWASALAFIVIGGWLLWASRAEEGVAVGEIVSSVISTNGVLSGVRIITTTFMLLFVAEMGDKSQLSVITLTVRSGSPLAVFVGGALGLTVVTFIGVWAGRTIIRFIPERLVTRAMALVFVGVGVLGLFGLF